MIRKIFQLFCLLMVMANSMAYAIEIFKIREDPFKYKNEAVDVEGFITQYVVGATSTTSFYYLKGDWGNLLKVITEKEKPEIGKRYKIRGIVNIDETNNDIFLVEMSRDCVNCEPIVVSDDKESNTLLYILIGAAGFFLILAIVIAIALVSKKKHEYLTPVPGQEFSGEMAESPEASIIEGSTIKMSTPPPGTLKLLPGRLEIISGEDTVKEIRFYKPKTQQEPEITFGRSTGPAYTHVQLKPLTVSAKHAKILYTGEAFILTNYSATNPTIINDQPMEPNASKELKEGDKIEMGEVVFVFHAK